MEQDPIKATEAEIKKWIDLIKQMFDEAKKQKEKLKSDAEAKLAAEEQKAWREEVLKELKGLRGKVDELPEGEAKNVATEQVADLELTAEGEGVNVHDMSEFNEVVGPGAEDIFDEAPSLDGPGIEALSGDLGQVQESMQQMADLGSMGMPGADIGGAMPGIDMGGGGGPSIGGGGGGDKGAMETAGGKVGETAGQTIGSTAGRAIGGAVGSIIPGAGTAVGQEIGEKIGSQVGKTVGKEIGSAVGKAGDTAVETAGKLAFKAGSVGESLQKEGYAVKPPSQSQSQDTKISQPSSVRVR